MAKNNFYAVRKGKQTGIFYSWDECKNAVTGFSGAEYRGFKTQAEAEAYLNGESVGVSFGEFITIDRPSDKNEVNIFTDGSFKHQQIAFGIYMQSAIKDFSFCGVLPDNRNLSTANQAGELLAALVGVQLGVDMGFTKMKIIYDNNGVYCYYNGEWTARDELSIGYVSLMNNIRLSKGLDYDFVKVSAHSSVNGNRRADALCRRAINMKSYIDLDKILRGNLKVTDVPSL